MTYRSLDLLRVAAKAPCCFRCFADNHGQVVAAHSNQARDGKGMGCKAHDFRIAFLCDRCHAEIDQGPGSREMKLQVWEKCHRATIGWLFRSGHLTVNVEPVEHVNPPKKPSAKIPKGRRLTGVQALPVGRKLQGGGKIQRRPFPGKKP